MPIQTDRTNGQAFPGELPHNIEAEQCLLGAVLIHNEAMLRVVSFLNSEHFFEPIHARIYDVCRTKVVTPVTLKTSQPPDLDIAGFSSGKYLARLAAEAITIIKAKAGRLIGDHQ